MELNHATWEAAERELINSGFTKYQSCIDGRTLFERDSVTDDFYGRAPRRAICQIKFIAIDPIWSGARNRYSIDFI